MEKSLKNLLDNTMSYISDKHAEYKEMPSMKGFIAYLDSCSYEIWQKLQTNTLHEDWLMRLNRKMRNSEQEYRVQNGLPRLVAAEYRDPLLAQMMGFDRQLFEPRKAYPSSNYGISQVMKRMRKDEGQKRDWKSLSFEHYLKENKIHLTGIEYEMFLFLEYTECFRKRSRQTIKMFCEENGKEKIGIYVSAAQEHMCYDPRVLLQNLGEDTGYSDTVKANSLKLFDYMYKQKLIKLPDDYINWGLAGVLDNLLNPEDVIDVANE